MGETSPAGIASDPGQKIVGYGVLVRHPGFVDRMLPEEQYTYYPIDNINHWICGPDRKSMLLSTEADALSLAEELQAKFGAEKYRFTVAVCRLTPQWFILHPKYEQERRRIGFYEQV